ncbi:MAG: ABC transporter ATP-binding protein [Phyllobacteriaceae bacterium]|nr:ABC transporter ATP-binding protein [Phyllobacteriaceae bacterium]
MSAPVDTSAGRVVRDAVGIHGLRHGFGGPPALDGVDLRIAPGELVALLGPSGCGKTTLLRSIAGFVRPDEGAVFIDGERMDDVPAGRRGVGIVFQNYALFPHMTVAANVAYGLEARRRPKAEIAATVERMLRLVQLEGMRDRHPRQLSGGQQQRVALARALATEPKVLLLDEPFAALDKNLRLDMQIEIRSLQRRFGITTVLVTHDQEEAMNMADRIAVMRAGRVEQFDTPITIYDRPASLFVNGFIGSANLLPARVVAATAEGCTVEIAGGARLALPRPAPAERDVVVSVRPENLSLSEPEAGGLLGTIRTTMPMGGVTISEVDLDGGRRVRITRLREAGTMPRAVGSRVSVDLVSAAAAAIFAAPDSSISTTSNQGTSP